MCHKKKYSEKYSNLLRFVQITLFGKKRSYLAR